jgi:hypothetical protein
MSNLPRTWVDNKAHIQSVLNDNTPSMQVFCDNQMRGFVQNSASPKLELFCQNIGKNLLPDFFSEFMAYVQNVKCPIEYFDIQKFKMRAITKYIYLPLSSLVPLRKKIIDHKIKHGILQHHVENEHKRYISVHGEKVPNMTQDFYNWQYSQVLNIFELVFKYHITLFFEEFEQYKERKRYIVVQSKKPFHNPSEVSSWAYKTDPMNPSRSFMIIASVLIHNKGYVEYIKNHETLLKIIAITTKEQPPNDTQTNG